MRSYGQYCPVAKAAELLADRWTVLIVRDLLLGVSHFNDLGRGLPGISRALLAQRLRRLERAGVVERRVTGNGRATEYRLTPAGRELQRLVDVLTEWGARWAFGDPDPADLDPVLLLWWMRGRVHRDRLPPQQVVVQFDFRGARTRTLWLLLDRRDVSVCRQHPGFEVDLLVTAEIAALFRVWLGRDTLAEAMRRDLIQLMDRRRSPVPFPAGSPGARWRRSSARREPAPRRRPASARPERHPPLPRLRQRPGAPGAARGPWTERRLPRRAARAVPYRARYFALPGADLPDLSASHASSPKSGLAAAVSRTGISSAAAAHRRRQTVAGRGSAVLSRPAR
jgi:DNA-binding HxlR family transcriptional regulator